MKQGNPNKRFGIIALLSAMIAGTKSMPDNLSHHDILTKKRMLLTNGGYAPIPYRLLNQRQKRKLAAQNR